MIKYCLKRLTYMIITLLILSVVIFVVIQLPLGNFVTHKVAELEAHGRRVSDSEAEAMERAYGLDRKIHVQYLSWMRGIVTRGDFGRSFKWEKTVTELLAERLPLTLLIGISSMMLTYVVAICVGVYSATHQYSIGDYISMAFSFLGMSVPRFLLAMIVMFFAFEYLGMDVAGIVSDRYSGAPLSAAKVVDFLQHLMLPLLVILITSTAGLIRIMRGNLLDELGKLYVTTARAKGLPEQTVIYKYPVRVAINPVISTVGVMLPMIVSGQTIVAIVLNLPTLGPLLRESLMAQDMYLAGSIVLILSAVVIVGMFVSDILLALADPRIRFGAQAR